jgi:hypothetical protein
VAGEEPGGDMIHDVDARAAKVTQARTDLIHERAQRRG